MITAECFVIFTDDKELKQLPQCINKYISCYQLEHLEITYCYPVEVMDHLIKGMTGNIKLIVSEFRLSAEISAADLDLCLIFMKKLDKHMSSKIIRMSLGMSK